MTIVASVTGHDSMTIEGSVTGHDFRGAANAAKSMWALAPAVCSPSLCRLSLTWILLAFAAIGLQSQQAQQPQGQSEQVHTGVTSGLDTEARLEALLAR